MTGSDAELLQRYVSAGAEEAFAELVRRHIDGVYSAAVRRVGGDTHLAEDVVQQVFAALAQNAAALVRHPALSAWLYVSTRNQAVNVVRRERRRKTRELEAMAMRENEPEAEAIDWRRVAPVLDAAIDQLNETDRTAVVLRYIERRSFAEVGATLRVSEDAARMRVDRALERMRLSLQRAGVSSTAAALGLVLTNHAVGAAPVGLAASVTTAALTAPPVAAASGALIGFMSTTKVIAGAVGIAALVAIGTATRQAYVLRQAEHALTAATQDNESLDTRRQLAVRRAVTAEEAITGLDKSIADAQAAKAQQEQRAKLLAAATGRPSAAALSAGQALMDRYPELRQAVIAYARAQVYARFGPYMRNRNLTPEQEELFVNWMVLDSGSVRRLTGPDGEPIMLAVPDWGNREKRREMERTLGQMLGMEAGQELRTFVEQYPARTLASSLAGSLYFTDTPLTAEQSTALVAAVAEASKLNRKTGWNGQYDWAAVLPKAKPVLSESQYAVLTSYQTQQVFEARMMAALRGDGAAAQASTNPNR
ncbi:sigma-70 family RNA polymerase sigma factor [Opitutus sp. ER46]|uniref:RNA polymerase sigma factor n=1 Tax=Opitutus sp. ER46 TaxID=2161864 RepID=UPI000D30E7C4|nr:sigma-70 family RNA polymerase sigma factor [Opitutus sp. ER46]PTX91426.1 hypothetical protein DB354_16170 [Opitutus sp. ER46]